MSYYKSWKHNKHIVKEEDTVAGSTHDYQNDRANNIREIHGDSVLTQLAPDGKIVDPEKFKLMDIIQILKNTVQINKSLADMGGNGETFGFNFTLTRANGFIHIDFTDSNNNVNVPDSAQIMTIDQPIRELHLFNNGPGTLNFDTNKSKGSRQATSVLRNQGNFPVKGRKKAVQSLNLVISGATSCDVAIICVT